MLLWGGCSNLRQAWSLLVITLSYSRHTFHKVAFNNSSSLCLSFILFCRSLLVAAWSRDLTMAVGFTACACTCMGFEGGGALGMGLWLPLQLEVCP